MALQGLNKQGLLAWLAIFWDAVSQGFIVITTAHERTHSGKMWKAHKYSVLDTNTHLFLITVGTKDAHMFFDIDCTGEMLVIITEGADRTTTAALPNINKNRNSANVSTTVIGYGATGGTTNGAVELEAKRIGATGVASKTVAVGSKREDNEWVLKSATKYVVSITTYAAVYYSVGFEFYEDKADD